MKDSSFSTSPGRVIIFYNNAFTIRIFFCYTIKRTHYYYYLVRRFFLFFDRLTLSLSKMTIYRLLLFIQITQIKCFVCNSAGINNLLSKHNNAHLLLSKYSKYNISSGNIIIVNLNGLKNNSFGKFSGYL